MWAEHWAGVCEKKPTSCCTADCAQCDPSASSALSCRVPGTVLWSDVPGTPRWHFEMQPLAASDANSIQRLTRGCAGGPRDGRYCERDADCAGTADVFYDRDLNGPFQPLDPNAPYHCVALEPRFIRVHKEEVLSLCAQAPPEDCPDLLDDYAADEGSPQRLVATGTAIDAGDPDFFAAEQFLRNDIGPDGRTIVPYVTGVPDLGAYESGSPTTHYGPRP